MNLWWKSRQRVQCEEVNWENVRCLPGGECVSVDGTHLGHNIPAAQRENLEELSMFFLHEVHALEFQVSLRLLRL